jgi:hypothetical protein
VRGIGVEQQGSQGHDAVVGNPVEEHAPLRPYIYAAGAIRLAFYLTLLAPRGDVVGYVASAFYVFTAPYFLLSVGAAVLAPHQVGNASSWHGSWGIALDALEFVAVLLLYTTLARRYGPQWAARALLLMLVGVGTAAVLLLALVGASRL